MFTGPYSGQEADHLCRIAFKAVERGHNVSVFLYGDGVHAQMNGQDPQAFYNIGAALEELAGRGVRIMSCQRCSKARGYVDGQYLEQEQRYPSEKSLDGIRIHSLQGLADMLIEADVAMTFGGGW